MMRIARALDLLRDNLPNTFINFVPLIDITITLVFTLYILVSSSTPVFRTCLTSILSVTWPTGGCVPACMAGLEGGPSPGTRCPACCTATCRRSSSSSTAAGMRGTTSPWSSSPPSPIWSCSDRPGLYVITERKLSEVWQAWRWQTPH